VKSLRVPLLLLALVGGAGCLQYNEPCGGLVENPERVAGYIDGDVFLDRINARHANNAIARLAAEAFLDAFPGGERGVDLAVVNGGAIRAEGGVEGPDGRCRIRNTLKKGPVTLGDIHQILLFENLVYAVTVKESVLFEVFEHSVSSLVARPQESNVPISSPSGRFLHVAGAAGTFVRVDCSKPPGSRITGLRVGSRTLQRNADAPVRIALTEFILRGGDGYAMLAPFRSDLSTVVAEKEGGLDNDITAAYLTSRYGTEDNPFPAYPEDRTLCTRPDKTACSGEGCCQSPIKLDNCAYPEEPPDE
jgi:5'-nucleotidase/UDP-sugar diphosphatase